MLDRERITLRIPLDLYERVRQAAEKERRSINEQIIWMLEQQIKTPRP